MYTEKVMDHFEHPRNVGEIENASGMGTVGNAKCGDIMRIYLDIDDNGIIRDVKFKTFGCGSHQQYGNGDGERQVDSGSDGSDEQGGM
jgi:nitrogen fixation NifU-like protein